jgi:hypothetical protein
VNGEWLRAAGAEEIVRPRRLMGAPAQMARGLAGMAANLQDRKAAMQCSMLLPPTASGRRGRGLRAAGN